MLSLNFNGIIWFVPTQRTFLIASFQKNSNKVERFCVFEATLYKSMSSMSSNHNASLETNVVLHTSVSHDL